MALECNVRGGPRFLIFYSDILAELDLPPSGISRLEEFVRFPNDKPEPMSAYYAGQIALRKLLNRVHLSLYDQPRESISPPSSR